MAKKVLLILSLMTVCYVGAARAQDSSGEVVRVSTKVVFIDTVVRDKSTGLPVTDLTRDDFQVFDNGKRRALTYFGHEGDRRRPLALLLFFNLDPEFGGAFRYLTRPEAQASLVTALSKLAPEDEVSVLAVNHFLGDKPVTFTDLTKERQKIAEAIAAAINSAKDSVTEKSARKDRRPKESMSKTIDEAVRIAALERPSSQVALVYVSDGINTGDMFFADKRRAAGEKLIRNNVNFSAINFSKLKSTSVALGIVYPLAKIRGASLTGGGEYLAKESGGIKVEVEKAEEFGAGLERITSSFASRYNLGFSLDENDDDDGRMHKLEVKIVTQGTRYKGRKLVVSARRGYYAPKMKAAPAIK